MSLNFPNLLKFGGKGSNYFPKKRIKTKHFVPRRENIDIYCSDNQRQPVPKANFRVETPLLHICRELQVSTFPQNFSLIFIKVPPFTVTVRTIVG